MEKASPPILEGGVEERRDRRDDFGVEARDSNNSEKQTELFGSLSASSKKANVICISLSLLTLYDERSEFSGGRFYFFLRNQM